MATSFPTALDVLPDPGEATGTADPGFYHDVMHSSANDSISALEQKVGITNSPVTSTIDYVQHHHQHTGTDGSARIQQYNAQAAVDGPVITALSAAALQVFQVSTAAAGPVVSVTPQAAAAAGMVIKGLSSQSADLLTFQNSTAQAIAGVTATGALYSSAGFQLTKGVGGSAFLNANTPTGELQYLNGAILRGYNGAYTGAGGAGEMFHLDAGQGFLKLGGAAGVAEIQLNAWNTARSTSLELHGKDNTDSGLTIFREYVDADGQVTNARSYLLRGNLGKTATGALIGEDTFVAASYPTYDGNTTYTKSYGISVQPGVAPTLTAGAVTISGNQTVTGNSTIQGSLAVTGAATFTTAITVPGSTNTGNATVQGTLAVTGNTTLSSLNATTATVTGSVSVGSLTVGGSTYAGETPGSVKMYAGFTAPTGFFMCDGAQYSRTTYVNLFNAITIRQNGTTTINSNAITGMSDTSNMKVGMPLSGTGIPLGTTIASITSGTAITMSANATASGTVLIVVAPYGVGDGNSTFNVPDFRGRGPIGPGQGTGLTLRILGILGGEENHALSIAELASHNHPDPGHGHGSTGGQSATHSHIPISDGSQVAVKFTASTIGLATGGTGATFSSASTGNTSVDHSHSVGTGNAGSNNTGTGTAHNNMAPYNVINFIIKN